MAITYPRNTESKYVLFKISTEEVLKRNASYPREDGGEISDLNPDLIYLEMVESPVPDYDPRYFIRTTTETPILDTGIWDITHGTQKRPVQEIEQVVENIEAEANQRVVPYEKQLKYLLLGVGLALHQIDGQSLTTKQSALRNLIISKAVKLWKNDDIASQLKTLIAGGQEPDLDTAAWEKE